MLVLYFIVYLWSAAFLCKFYRWIHVIFFFLLCMFVKWFESGNNYQEFQWSLPWTWKLILFPFFFQKVDYPLELDVYEFCSDELRQKLQTPRQVLPTFLLCPLVWRKITIFYWYSYNLPVICSIDMDKTLRELENVKLGLKVEDKKKEHEVNMPTSEVCKSRQPSFFWYVNQWLGEPNNHWTYINCIYIVD